MVVSRTSTASFVFVRTPACEHEHGVAFRAQQVSENVTGVSQIFASAVNYVSYTDSKMWIQLEVPL